jgi:uncharacterized protein YecT (DUF1311 family)
MIIFRTAILLMLITSNVSALESNETLESGDACTKNQKLPEGFLCYEELIIDCKVSGTRIDYQICRGDELNRLDLELNKKYQQILKKYNAPNTEYANYKKAKAALIRAQKAWIKFRQEDCDMPIYLNITGTAQSPMMMDCAINHTKKRIEDFDSGFYE